MRLPRSVRDADVDGKVVLVRADLNVPLEEGRVADDARIRASLPTLGLLLERGAREIRVCSHLGRPKTEEDRAKYAMAPVRERVAELVGDDRVKVLENTRFNAGETKNDPGFAQELADGCDLYVNDAFGSAHRAHSSTEAVAHILPAYAGLLLLAELENLGRLLGEVERPFVIVSGGAKVEDKVAVLKNLGSRADQVLIGGKMAEDVRAENPFPFEVMLPTDVDRRRVVRPPRRRDAGRALRRTARRLARARHRPGEPSMRSRAAIDGAKTVFWNGPMGVFEWPRFAEGTFAVAGRSPSATGSRSSAAATRFGRCTRRGSADRISWVSTGGGASLELLEGKELPGVAAIPEA